MKPITTIEYELGKTVGRAEGINECGREVARFVPPEHRAEFAVLVMRLALQAAGEALRPEQRETVQ